MSPNTRLFALAAILTLAAGFASAADPADFLVWTHYGQIGRLYVPEDYDPGQSYPLVVFYHGLGEAGTDNLKQINGNIDNLYAECVEREAFLYAPQSFSGFWSEAMVATIMDVVDYTIASYNIEEGQVYVTGLSAGGQGVCHSVEDFGGRIAAAVGVCMLSSGAERDEDDEWVGRDVWLFHAANDSVVGVSQTRNLINDIREADGDKDPLVFPLDADPQNPYYNTGSPYYSDGSTYYEENHLRYTEYDTGNHGIWGRVYQEEWMYDWLFSKVINNLPPRVDAGRNVVITLPTDTVNLDGEVSDDGEPQDPGQVTVQWTKASGPGTVTFGNASLVDTTATFSTDGTYVLCLTADDGEKTADDEVTITVNADMETTYDGFATPGDYANATNLAAQTGGGSGDWNSNWTDVQSNAALSTVTGSLTYTGLATTAGSASSPNGSRVHYRRTFDNDPDMFAPGGEVWFSLLFSRSTSTKNMGVTIAAVSSEYVGCGFRINNNSNEVCASINGVLSEDGVEISAGQTVLVVGRVAIDRGETDGDHVVDIWVNPNLSNDLSYAALRSGNSWIDRSYAAFEDSSYVNFYSHQDNSVVFDEFRMGASWADVVGEANTPPDVEAGNNATIELPIDTVNLDGTVSDDGLPADPGQVTVEWTKQSGPGTVTFGNDEAVDTTATFSIDGTYVLRLTAYDGELYANDEVTITVDPEPQPQETALIYEGFETPGDYTNATDVAAQTGGGFGDWYGDWADVQSNAAGKTVTSSLTYTGLTTTAGSLSKASSSRLHYVRQFTNDPNLFAADGEVWFSVLFSRSTATKNMGLTIAANSSEYIGCGFRIDNGSTLVKASINGTLGQDGVTIGSGDTVLVVGRVSIDAGDTSGDHVVDIWVNPDLGTDLSNAALKSGDSFVDRSYANFESSSYVNLYSHQDNSVVYDEIRVGATFDDVAP